MFLTLKEYLDGAKRIILKRGIKKVDEDFIAYVAHYMMRADENYKDNIGCREGFRIASANYGILNYFKRKQKMGISLNYNKEYNYKGDNFCMLDSIPSKEKTPDKILENKEIIDFIYNNKFLTSKQRFCITKYYIDGMTMLEIGNELGISKWAVSMNITKGIGRLREYFKT